MTVINSSERWSSNSKSYLKVEKNNPNTPGNNNVFLELHGHSISIDDESFAAFTQQDCYEIIKAIATEAGLYADENDQVIHIKKPKPPKSKEDVRREELLVEYFSSTFEVSEGEEAAVDRIIELEKKLGEL